MLLGEPDERRAAARAEFDLLATKAYAEAHPLLRRKFTSPEKLPYYNQQRELAALLAAATPLPPQLGGDRSGLGSGSEKWFESSDSKIGGRPDFLDAARHEVVDYKTGYVADGGGSVSEREQRQLNLYAYLARESGITVEVGRIVRANGNQPTVQITSDQAVAEAEKARALLIEYNTSVVGSTFEDLADPSPDVCRMCSCQPLCEAFWIMADASWQEECGVHLEGTVVHIDEAVIQETALVTLEVDVTRGTVEADSATIEQVPLAWLEADGDRHPKVGDVIRVVDGRLVNSSDPVLIRTDRIMTTVWRVQGTARAVDSKDSRSSDDAEPAA
jgi:hypothetical protein